MDPLQSKIGSTSEIEIEIEIGEMDRISELPEFIVHHILSFLVTPKDKELVRMSVLSKKWFLLTASYPILCFRSTRFTSLKVFYKYVEYATTRFCHQNLAAHKFELRATLWDYAEVDIVNRCLELVLKNGVRELDIHINDSTKHPSIPRYHLPNTLLSAASVLESLSLGNCVLPSSLMVNVVRFKSLIHLNLYKVPIDDEMIKSLTTSFPLLQDLEISKCRGFQRFCVYGHPNLQFVYINFDAPLETIDIEAPNLQEVDIDFDAPLETIDIKAPNLSHLWITDRNKIGAPRMNLALCKKLTTVYYSGNPLPNDFLSNFPFIEHLHLVSECEHFKCSSHSLRTLVLDSDCDLEDIEFIPNLVLFLYAFIPNSVVTGGELQPLLRDPTLLKGCMHYYPDLYIETHWFQKLRRFLDMKNGFKVLNLYIHAQYSQEDTEFEKLKVIELPPFELEHVELQLDTREGTSAHIALVDVVLCCCRPRSLTLRSSSKSTDVEEQSDLVKFTYKRLVEQEDQDHTKVQIVGPFSSEAQKHLRDLKSSSAALPPERNAIIFIKEQLVII